MDFFSSHVFFSFHPYHSLFFSAFVLCHKMLLYLWGSAVVCWLDLGQITQYKVFQLLLLKCFEF